MTSLPILELEDCRVVEVLGPDDYSCEYIDGLKPYYSRCPHDIMQRDGVNPPPAPEVAQESIMPIEVPIQEPIVEAAPVSQFSSNRLNWSMGPQPPPRRQWMQNPPRKRSFRSMQRERRPNTANTAWSK